MARSITIFDIGMAKRRWSMMRGMEEAMAVDSWWAMHRAASVNLQKEEGGDTVVEGGLLEEFGEELEGDDGVSKIDENEVLGEDRVFRDW
ncbi:hypothetical protein PanWU01x14_256670 [Parasponia andersonii]|uniref:Uncharacterized protein n=1 Tax=Parasponia andersonii TaxID=3476 RepID=A0A2P5BAH5_PARAD|nr:hypothetical protein PanWU01x14_256670 [Parasponia andersonii]